MTRRMHGGEIQRLAMVANGDGAQSRPALPKDRPASAKTESGQTVSIAKPEGWLDRIQVGFPRANWW